MKKKQNNKLLFSLLFIISTLLMFAPLLAKSTFQRLSSFGLISIFLINFASTATIFLPNPGIVSIAVGGSLYNPLLVAILAALGSTLGEIIGFAFGLSSKKVINLKTNSLFYHLATTLFKKYAKYIVPVFAFIPNPLIDGLGILAGITSYPLKKFLLLVLIGRVFRSIILAYTGHFLQ